jgi:hypothetical protein
MTIEQAAKLLSEELCDAPWATTVGVGEHEGKPCIYLYLKASNPSAASFVKGGWHGFPVLIRKMSSPRPLYAR